MHASQTSNSSSPPSAPERGQELHCMEMMGGNRAIRQTLASPGFDIWLESRPHEAAAGGDLYYFSVCGSGRVTRFAIGDVSGHGADADDVALTLRRLMRKYINLLDQTAFAHELNRAFIREEAAEHFATILLMTYFAPTDHLIICNGGHPPPLWYSRRLGQWRSLHRNLGDTGPSIRRTDARYMMRRVANLPLGVIEPTDYYQFAVHLDPDDLVLLYTDALVEAQSRDGEFLQEKGLLEMVGRLDVNAPHRLVGDLFAQLDDWRGGVNIEDDQTAVLLHHNASNPPRMSVGRAADVLARMVGLRKVDNS